VPHSNLRIGFWEAIHEKNLLKPRFDQLSFPQQTALLAMYGCELDSKLTDKRGFTHLDYWCASQGAGEHDELGYLRKVTRIPYAPKEFAECWSVSGVRSGKTDNLASTIVAYEAVCGGHEEFTRKGRPVICFQIAQDIRMAKYSLHSIRQNLESMAWGAKLIQNVVADRIELKNGVHIMVSPPTVKSIRGFDSPVSVLDEVGVWYQDADSANPDTEIYEQASKRQAQFQYPKLVGISSPWNKAGLLYRRWEAGTNGCKVFCANCLASAPVEGCDACALTREKHLNRLVMTFTTAEANPIVPKSWLRSERNKDPKTFERECLGVFQDSVSGFLSSALIERAKSPGIAVRQPQPRFHYIAAIDPAFRRDAFAFTIVHADPTVGIVQDYAQRWHDPFGEPLNPADVFPELAAKLSEYGIKSVFSDQYTIEALQYIANQFGFGIEEVTFTSSSKAEIYANLQQLLNQGRLILLDHTETVNELKSIEKKLTQAGHVKISAPEGLYDDMATVIAIAAREAVWMLPKLTKKVEKTPTIIERHLSQLNDNRKRAIRDLEYDW
jgi:hypothetical protein